jgi:30S ribosomal protein S31
MDFDSEKFDFRYFFYFRRSISKKQINRIMGKGDIKTRKGKLANGSFGKSRKRNETMPEKTAPAAAALAEKPKKPAARAKAKKA